MEESKVTVLVGDGVVTIKREGSNRASLANILGTGQEDSLEVLCLDRLVHASHEQQFGEWMLSGAVTTLLSQPLPASEAVECAASARELAPVYSQPGSKSGFFLIALQSDRRGISASI